MSNSKKIITLMKKLKIYIIAILSVCILPSCEDFLERDPQTNTSLEYEEIFKDVHAAPGFLNHAYTYLTSGFYRMDDALFASASDEAKHSESGSLIQLFNNNAISPSINPDNVWNNMYNGIRVCNIFLKELDEEEGLIVKHNSIPEKDRSNYRGQALFLRAYFHFELLKRYQRIFYVTKVLDSFNEDEIYEIPQLGFHAAVEQIVNDCDSAAKILPDKVEKEALGRPTKASSLALKSRLLLYAASPLNNPANDMALWERAEEAAKELYDKRATFGVSLMNQYAQIFTTPYNSEIIFATMAELTNNVERNNFPISYQGKGLTNPTQDLVDLYVMDGTRYNNAMDGYNEEDPYAMETGAKRREARFYATIIHNNMNFKGSRVETFVGGKDGLYATSTATKTGYYMRKYLAADIDLEKNTQTRHMWILFRYAEVILNYAEARNEALSSPANDVLIHDLLNLIRERGGLRPFRTQDYIQTKEEMREYIKLERRKELALEEHRFWDLRRWKDEEHLKAPVHGMRIERVQDGVDAENNPVYKYTYQKFEVEKRSFDPKFYWYPIPRTEILKYRNKGIDIIQNDGWE